MHDKETLHKLRSQNISGTRVDLPQAAEVPDAVQREETSPSDSKSTADHDYCSPTDREPADRPDHIRLLSDKLTSVEKALKASEHLLGKELQEAVFVLLDHAERSVAQGLDEETLANTVSALLQTQGPGPGAGDSVYSSPLLRAVGGWLGRQFHAANACISQQVEGFKVRHIERITDLPPAEELAGELFPEAMRVLLLSWMGLDEASALWKRQSEYPIVLLILEFANHNLITGVAHVLYSSLICK